MSNPMPFPIKSTITLCGVMALVASVMAGYEYGKRVAVKERDTYHAEQAVKLGVASWGSDPTGAPLFQWRRITCTPLGVTKGLKEVKK